MTQGSKPPTLTKQTPATPSGSAEPPPGRPVRPPTSRRQSPTATFLRTGLPLIAAIVALSLYSNSRNSAFLTWNNYDNILSQIAVLGILAAGQTFLIIGGQLDLSVGSMVSFISVVAAKLFAHSMPTPLVIVICLAISTTVGLVFGLIVAYLRVPPFILTLGGMSVFASAALVLSDNHPISVLSGLESLGFGTFHGLRAPGLALVITLIVLGLVLHFTRFGRNVFAFGSSPQAAFYAGLPARRLTVELFVLNGLVVGVAGLVMMARLASGDPNSGSGLELNTIAVTVLGGAALAGGRGTMIGTFLGAMVFGTVTASLTFLQVPGAYQSLVSGGILIFAVVATAAADLRAGRVSAAGGMSEALRARFSGLIRRPEPAGATPSGSPPDPPPDPD